MNPPVIVVVEVIPYETDETTVAVTVCTTVCAGWYCAGGVYVTVQHVSLAPPSRFPGCLLTSHRGRLSDRHRSRPSRRSGDEHGLCRSRLRSRQSNCSDRLGDCIICRRLHTGLGHGRSCQSRCQSHGGRATCLRDDLSRRGHGLGDHLSRSCKRGRQGHCLDRSRHSVVACGHDARVGQGRRCKCRGD